MVKNREPFPNEGAFIMGRVVDIQNQYIYVDIPDYDGLPSEDVARGMIHISEISSRWVKNIRSIVRIGQRLVLRVVKVVPDKGQIDLSLRRVNSAQKDLITKEHKYGNKFEVLLQFLTETEGIDLTLDQAYELIGWPIKEQFDFYQEAIEILKEEGEDILNELKDVPDHIKDAFLKIVKENVEISTVRISGKIKIINRTGDGINIIKETLNKVAKVIDKPKETRKLSLLYLGAPYYRLEIVSKDYLDAESILSDALEVLESSTQKTDGLYEFIRK
ncbi:MAG TPA: S1 RNA-binding domain-containing protein [Candidatus Nanopelagicaceae bacterium]|nr:S1 RNA-binding domain-containing protein [Candidatus Nanopelagicaceae bacterium]